jgi:citrate lyase subunit beta / citryl-CoA lyase
MLVMFRSLIFVPSNTKRFVDKAKTLNADIVCFDLEDSVPENEKYTARQIIMKALTQRTEYKTTSVYVRINSFESGLAFLDLKAIIQRGIDGIVIPKVNDQNEVDKLVSLISTLEQERGIENNTIKLMPSIETAKGVVNAYSISKADQRVNALVFGVFDFLYDMHLDYEDDGIGYAYARAKIPIDARAAGAAAIDAIWQKIDDIIGLKKDALVAKRLGYSGKSIIHPNQIEPVHKVFLPSKNEIQWAKKVVEALDEATEEGSSRGAVKLEGKMIDAVHYKQAKAILEADQVSQLEYDISD